MTILNLRITVHKIPCVNFKITANNSLHRKREKLFLLTFNSYFNQSATENIIMVLTSAKVREEKELFNAAFIPSVL